MEFTISLFLLFILISTLYSLLDNINSKYFSLLNYKILEHSAHYNSFLVTLNSYSIKHGYSNQSINCIVSDKIYCNNKELNLTGTAQVYLRRGGGN